MATETKQVEPKQLTDSEVDAIFFELETAVITKDVQPGDAARLVALRGHIDFLKADLAAVVIQSCDDSEREMEAKDRRVRDGQ